MISKQQSFIEGAVLLTISALIVKLIGAMFKIPLAGVLGGSGMGYFMTAYGIFNPIYAMLASAFPVAVSRLTAKTLSKQNNGEEGVLLAAAVCFFPVGLFLSAILYANAEMLCNFIGNPDAYRSVLAIAPSLLFCCICAVFRGYFEGTRKMGPTAFSQIFEAVVKLLTGIYFSYRCINSAVLDFHQTGIVFGQHVRTLEDAMDIIAPRAAAAAISGVCISTAAGCIFMVFCYILSKKGDEKIKLEDSISYIPPLVSMAIPVCISALVLNFTSLIDLLFVMKKLSSAIMLDFEAVMLSHPALFESGIEKEELANFLYGCYTGLGVTIFNIIPSLTASLGMSALPMITILYTKRQKDKLKQAVKSVMKITAIVTVPAGMGLATLAEPILLVLFNNNPLEAQVTVPIVQILGISAIFVAMVAPIFAMLQAVGRPYVLVKLMTIGALIKLSINYCTVAIPSINIKGAPISTLFSYLAIFTLGVFILSKSLEIDINPFSLLFKPFISSLFCCGGAIWLYDILQIHTGNLISLAFSIIFAIIIYGVAMIVTKGVALEDFELLINNPKFKRTIAKDAKIE